MAEARPEANLVLSAMPPEDREHLRPHLVPVDLRNRERLFELNGAIDRVYFPTGGVIAVVGSFEDGTTAEMGSVGCEGILPAAAILDGGARALNAHVVQVTGSALLAGASVFRAILRESAGLRALLHRYLEAFMCQIMQIGACNSVHAVQERFARWILMTHDRVAGDTFDLTQQALSEMLGVHRPTVTVIARSFQAAGLITYRRGSITVVDRRGLEEASCECYDTIRRHYRERLGRTG